ncbi:MULTISPECIES: GH32 C-terminal domain-containing protein [unclassified Brachybacterium]|uniref:GH32 C-terminal domain-containing protein n=1 Tax=unclassified Brachybacterium TaxID=2623841 RepID=UPI00402AC1BD
MGSEPNRPGYHYTPERNWMNDPNGMVFHDGLYHLYYQYNPEGSVWGNMSWGHATSPDLMTWTEQTLAIGQSFDDDGNSIEDIFSGSVVVDHGNTSGLGTGDEDPLIALYTSAYTGSHPEHAGKQAQSLAFSTDGGFTWEKYEGNPVADRDSGNFRDPKVFWYEGATPAESHWVMVAVEATDYQVVVYTSDDLLNWEFASDFGPANAVGGIWECPDLFELPVDGNPEETRWVMIVNLNPGSVAGGSGGQYFVGDFDGTTFTAENIVDDIPAPDGEVLWDFENGDFSGWDVANEEGQAESGPFGSAPAEGPVSGQQSVNGVEGGGFVNSFHGGDGPVGAMESEPFTIEREHLGFLVGGGNNPHREGTRPDNDPPAGTALWNGFEEADGAVTLADMGWTGSGDLAATGSPSTAGGEYALGDKRINTWEGGPKGDDNLGTLTSPEFTIDGDYLNMLVGGGARTEASDETLEVQLMVDGEVVRSQTGPEDGALNWRHWDLSELQGRTAQLRVVDEATGGWGHLTLDHVVMGDEAALPRGDETTVNLVVDGEVVRTATGSDSENLDWHNWEVGEFEGQQASLRIVDNSSGGWGHILVDHFVATDAPIASSLENYQWMDWGSDYYATVSYSDAPDGKRITQGWMNNWLYAGDVPVSPWVSAMTLPREVGLSRTDHGIELVHAPVQQAEDSLVEESRQSVADVAVAEGTAPLSADGETISGDMLRIDLRLDPGSATRAGVVVSASDGFTADPAASADDAQGTLVGYDAERGKAFVDRSRSGEVDFHSAFPGQVEAPVTLEDDGTVSFSIWLDRSSVEVFAQDGTRTMTELIFPGADSQQVLAFAEGGDAKIVDATVAPVAQTMFGAGATDPTDPTDPSEPTEPVEPTDPAAPTAPAEPTEPTGPAEPTEPVEPTGPSDHPVPHDGPGTGEPSQGGAASSSEPPQAGGSLALTGVNAVTGAVAALALVVAGAAAVLIGRFRRRGL